MQLAHVTCFTLLTLCAARSAASQTTPDRVKRGRYLVAFGGCSDCHTPKIFTLQGPQPDTSRFLAGYPSGGRIPAVPFGVLGPDKWGALTTNDLTAWLGPWGVSFAANLTPDPSGLAAWTEDLFIKTMRTGKHMGVGRAILPPMPWLALATLTDEDLKAVFAYLRSLKPVHNEVPTPIPLSRAR